MEVVELIDRRPIDLEDEAVLAGAAVALADLGGWIARGRRSC